MLSSRVQGTTGEVATEEGSGRRIGMDLSQLLMLGSCQDAHANVTKAQLK